MESKSNKGGRGRIARAAAQALLGLGLLTLLAGCAERSHLYIDPAMITSVRFSKPCQPVSRSLAECNGVLLTFAASSVKPVTNRSIPHRFFEPFELKK